MHRTSTETMEKAGNISGGRALNRRAALSTGAKLALGGMTAAWTSSASARRPGKIIGCYSSVDEILAKPEVIDELQHTLGVTDLLAGSSINMPGWLREMNLLAGGRSMFATHTDDDSALIRAIDETHRRGMRFWLYFSGHHNSPEDRDVMAETFDGLKFADLPAIDYALSQGELTTCFEKKRVREYVVRLFGHAAAHYDVDMMYVSHTRYATPSFWSNLTGCACPECRLAAEREGRDMDAMARAAKSLIATLQGLDPRTVERAADTGLTFGDFIAGLGARDGVMDWLYFRASVVGRALGRMHDVVHDATGDRCGFVTDTHNATMSLLVGHNYTDLIGGGSDGLHPLSWCDYQHVSVIAAWANQLCRWVEGLDESAALRASLAFFGWEGLGLPDKRIADLRIGKNSQEHTLYGEAAQSFYGYFNPTLTERLMTHEWEKLAAIDRGRIPAHPVIKGTEWPAEVCRTLMARTAELGLDGYVFQGTDNLIGAKR